MRPLLYQRGQGKWKPQHSCLASFYTSLHGMTFPQTHQKLNRPNTHQKLNRPNKYFSPGRTDSVINSYPSSSLTPCPYLFLFERAPHLIFFCNFSLGYGPSATPASTLRAYPLYPQDSTLANLLPALTQALAGIRLMTMCMHKHPVCKNPAPWVNPSLRGTAKKDWTIPKDMAIIPTLLGMVSTVLKVHLWSKPQALGGGLTPVNTRVHLILARALRSQARICPDWGKISHQIISWSSSQRLHSISHLSITTQTLPACQVTWLHMAQGFTHLSCSHTLTNRRMAMQQTGSIMQTCLKLFNIFRVSYLG